MRTKRWTFLGLRKEFLKVYSQEKIDIALELYHQCKSATKTVQALGYPIKIRLL